MGRFVGEGQMHNRDFTTYRVVVVTVPRESRTDEERTSCTCRVQREYTAYCGCLDIIKCVAAMCGDTSPVFDDFSLGISPSARQVYRMQK